MALLRLSWKLRYILGLGRIQGEKMASLGIPFHQVKYTQKHAFVILSGKSCLLTGSYSENELHLVRGGLILSELKQLLVES